MMAKEYISPTGVEKGAFEVSDEKFTEFTCDRPPEDVQFLELRESAPALFVGGTDKIPRLLERVFRRACDEVMMESRGMYCHTDGSIVRLYFYDMTAAVAKTKASIISGKIPQLLEAAQKDEGFLDTPLPHPVKSQQQIEKPSEVSRMLKEGMPDNPSLELVRFWVSRVVHEVAAAQQKIPLTHEMVDLAAKSGSFFLPLWSPAGGAIVGSSVNVHSQHPKQTWDTGEGARLDVMALISAVFQICVLSNKGQNALVVLPLRASSLMDQEMTEFFAAILRRLPQDSGRSVILCVKDVPRDGVTAKLAAGIDFVLPFVRACTFETGLLSYPDLHRQFPKLFAAGFDSGEVGLGEHEQVFHMPKYAAFYRNAGVKTYVTGVASRYVFDAAVKEGFTYISGPLIRPKQKGAFTVEKLPASAMGGT